MRRLGLPNAWIQSLVLVCVSLAACADDSPKFGPPGGLQGKKLDVPDASTGSSSSSGGEGGTTSEGGTTEGGTNGCTPPGSNAAACPKFATDIFPLMAKGGAWGCGNTGCHSAGGTDPQPMADAAGTYTLLTTYTNIKGKPYVNKGCIEPDQSMIVCNLSGPPDTCGAAQMPQGGSVTQADFDKLKQWIACGSPP